MKILVADDHALIREALKHVLRELDSDAIVLEASDCDGVRRLAADHADLDLLLLDLKFPGAGGLTVLTELRRDHPTLPIVILSAIEDANTMREVLARGAMGFIPKSSSNQVMLSALRLVFSGGRYIPPEMLSGSATTGEVMDFGADASPLLPSAAGLGLTERQQQVLALMAQGNSNKLICRELGLAEATVKIHVTAILRALKVTSRAQAIVAVNRLGLRLSYPSGTGDQTFKR
jgi:DNA-binding NarL/FixJ family response regulator